MSTSRPNSMLRRSVLSLFLALMAFSFLAFGTASAHTLNHATGASQAGVNTSPTVVRILSRQQFSPSAVTVKSGTHVRIANKSLSNLLVFYNGGSIVLAPKASFMIVATQTQSVAICAGATLTITVV